jgi:hypothetical protein
MYQGSGSPEISSGKACFILAGTGKILVRFTAGFLRVYEYTGEILIRNFHFSFVTLFSLILKG